jgi:chemotaxis signal transduction protein
MASRTQDAVEVAPQGERVLRFALGENEYALRLRDVAGLASLGPVRAVPGAPPEVVGLAEWRGSLLTVLDLPLLLGRGAAERDERETCLVQLAAPLRGVAFFLPAPVYLWRGDAEPGDSAWISIDAHRLVRDLESRVRRGR